MEVAAVAAAAVVISVVAGVASAALWRSESTMEGLVRMASCDSWMRRMASAMVIEVPLMLIMAVGLVPLAEEGAMGMVVERRLIWRVAKMGGVVVLSWLSFRG